ncbi:MAG: TRCF domain-containing protein, partial [Ignavibacteria bacterium]
INIIEEAVLELKENEFKDLFKSEESLKKLNESIKKKAEEKSTVIENDLNALIPKDYIENDTERLNIYRRLYELKTEDELKILSDELGDRFGEYLEDVKNLLRMIRIKIKATRIGIDKLTVRGSELSFYFPEDKENKIFQSMFFTDLLDTISKSKSKKYNIAPEKEKLIIKINLNSQDDEGRLSEIERILFEDHEVD